MAAFPHGQRSASLSEVEVDPYQGAGSEYFFFAASVSCLI
jgi:hypothetical protein